MTLQAALRRIPDLLHGIAALLAGVVLCAIPSQLPAQTPSFFFASPQVLPGTETSQYTFSAVAVDPSGNIFLLNSLLGTIEELPAGSAQLAPVAVTGVTNPQGIAVDVSGNLYITNQRFDTKTAETLSSIIKLTPRGVQSSIGSGWVYPTAVAVDPAGDVFVVESRFNQKAIYAVFKVAANSGATTFLNFVGLKAPSAIAVDPVGNVYLADYGLGAILKLSADGATQTTLATGILYAQTVATDLAGNLFYINYPAIDEIPAGSTTTAPTLLDTLAPGFTDLAVDIHGNLIFGTAIGNSLVEMQRNSVNFGSAQICVSGWTTVAECRTTQTLRLIEGDSTPVVRFLAGGVVDPDFVATYGTDECDPGSSFCSVNVTFSPKSSGAHSAVMQLLDASGTVQSSTLVYGQGIGPQVAFGSVSQSAVETGENLNAIAVDAAGNVFAAHPLKRDVLEYPVGGAASRSIGTGLLQPVAVAVDAVGDVYIADSTGNQVAKVAPNGTQTTVGTNLSSPQGVALDNAGNVYIADQGNNRIVKVLPLAGYQTVVAGGHWNLPVAVAVDSEGNVYAIDGASASAPQVRKLTVSTGVSTVLGSGFTRPCGLAVDAAGDVYVGDLDKKAVVEIPISGGALVNLGTGIQNPCGVALDPTGDVYVADYGHSRILKLARTQAPSLSFASTHVGNTSSDSPQSVQFENIGNAPLVAAGGLTNGTNFARTAYTGAGTDCTEVFWLEPGTNCGISFSFTPTLAGPLTSADLLATNANPDSVLIGLKGTGTDVASTILSVGGSGQSAIYGYGFAKPLSVLVQDASGAGVANVTVTFAGVGIKFASTTELTNASGYATAMATASAVGPLTASAKAAGIATPAVFTETGTLRPLVVTPSGFNWDVNTPFTPTQYSITGLINGDTVTGVPALKATGHVGSPIGHYQILASKGTLVAPANYTFVYEPGLLILDKPNNISAIYGWGQSSAEGTPFRYPLTIFVEGELAGNLGGVPVTFTSSKMTFSSTTVTTAAPGYSQSGDASGAMVTATPTAVGSLFAKATITGTNFSVEFDETGIAIPPAAIAISAGNAQTAVYSFKFAQPFKVLVTDKLGNPSKNAIVTFSGTGIKLQNTTATTGADGIASAVGYPTAVGSLEVSASVTGASTAAIFHATGTPAPLTVTAGNATGKGHSPLPKLTYAITGLVNGDKIAVVAGTPGETTTATMLSPAGNYPITITRGNLASPNYAFTKFVNGTLTLEP